MKKQKGDRREKKKKGTTKILINKLHAHLEKPDEKRTKLLLNVKCVYTAGYMYIVCTQVCMFRHASPH